MTRKLHRRMGSGEEPEVPGMNLSPLFLALALCLAGTARGGEIFVDVQKGSDLKGDGSRAHPFKTLTKGLGVAKAGDIVRAAPGIYDLHRGEKFPLVLPAGVSLLGAGMRDVFLIGGSSWQPALSVVLEGGVSLPSRVSSLSVQGGWFALEAVFPKGAGSWSLSLEKVAFEGAGAGVKIRALPGGAKLSFLMDHCLLEENWGVGLLLDSGGGALDFQVTGSVLVRNGYDGLLLWSRSGNSSVKGRILQSTLAGNGGGGFRLLSEKGASSSLEVLNSILWGNRSGDLIGVASGAVSHCLLGGGPAAGKAGNVKGDPGFLASGDFHLGARSQAVGVGDPKAAGLPGKDLDGQPLPVGKAPDAGADQRFLHTLMGDPRGLRLKRTYHMEAYTLPSAAMVVFLSPGTLSPGFKTPPLTGSLRLDFIAALIPFGSVLADKDGLVSLEGTMFTSASLIGVRLYFQGVALRIQAGKVGGGWTNVLSPWAVSP